MKVQLSSTHPSIINVGLYGTCLEPDTSTFEEEFDKAKQGLLFNHKALTRTQYRKVKKASNRSDEYRYNDYLTEVCRVGFLYIKDAFVEVRKALPFLGEMTFVGAVSPKEYNFTNDSLDFNIEVPDNYRELVKDWIKSSGVHDELDSFLAEKNKSYSGFHSFLPQSVKALFEDKSEYYFLGSVIDFILTNIDFDRDELQDEFTEHLLCNCAAEGYIKDKAYDEMFYVIELYENN